MREGAGKMTPGEVERREELDWIWERAVENENESAAGNMVAVVVETAEEGAEGDSLPPLLLSRKEFLRPLPMNESVRRRLAPPTTPMSVEERGELVLGSFGGGGRPRSDPKTGMTVVERGPIPDPVRENRESRPEGTRDWSFLDMEDGLCSNLARGRCKWG